MTQQAKNRNNIFGAVLTGLAPAANFRGEKEANRSVLQKLRFPDGEHTVISAEAIRNRLREMLREDDLPSNRSRLKNERELMVRYEGYPNPTKWADDKLFGFLALNKRKMIEETEDALQKTKKAIKTAKDDAEKTKLQEKITKCEEDLKKLNEYSGFQGDTILRVNYAVSLDKFEHDSTMHQSPKKIVGEFEDKEKADSSAIIQREVHVTAFQYPFGLNLNDIRSNNEDEAKLYKKWMTTLLRAISELNGVAGNHARAMFPFAPVSIVLRLTARRTPDFDLYGFKSKPEENQRELFDALISGQFPKDEFYLGGRIAKEYKEAKKESAGNGSPDEAKDVQPEGEASPSVHLFDTATQAIEKLIEDAGLEQKEGNG